VSTLAPAPAPAAAISTAAPSDLIAKYNVPGPRYTSYPTVPFWETNPTQDQWSDSLLHALRSERPRTTGAALYVHIPFCKSLCTYCGCNTRITRNASTAIPYVDSVLKEWSLYRSRLADAGPFPLAELHFGGGTPTFLEPEELERLVTGIVSPTERVPGFEFSIEADPRVTTPAHLDTLARLQFTRLSLGIQDFDPTVQSTVNRVQDETLVRQVTEQARAAGFKNVNFDLIYGLPFQTETSIRNTVSAVARLRPDRIAFYAYAHVPWIKPWQRNFTEDDLPAGDQKRRLYELGRALLEEAGYREVGMDHFALESDSLWTAVREGTLHRNFMGYTSRPVFPLIGLGVSAIGDSWNIFAQNEKSIESYTRRLDRDELPIFRGHVLTEEDLVLRRHILDLMTRFETRWDEPGRHVPFLEEVAARLTEPERDGLVRLVPHGCKVTEAGRAFLRNLCMALDARLTRKAPQTRLFSQTI
jgi:oxygen-independent coproporphyrinogen-3 oxidase